MKKNDGKTPTNRLKPAVWLPSLLLILGLAAAGTLAWLISQPKPLPNTFAAAKVTTAVEETTDDPLTTKSDVSIKNTGDMKAFIRVAVTALRTKTENGNTTILPNPPVLGTDYEMDMPEFDKNWFKQGDYYYYRYSVRPGDNTAVLIKEAKPLKNAAGQQLELQIICSGIQYDPAEAVRKAWGVRAEGDKLSPWP